jgi:hypothetical protein
MRETSGKMWKGACALLMSIAAGYAGGCAQGGGGTPLPAVQVASSDPWQYPLRLGDTKGKVHELLTFAKRPSPDTEEYPSSGLTVLFDDDRRVTKLTFAGPANAIYSETPSAPILTDRQILFGLTTHTGEADFRRILGAPAREMKGRAGDPKELHCVWKKGGYVVEAFFLSAEITREEKFPIGSLIRVEVYRGL